MDVPRDRVRDEDARNAEQPHPEALVHLCLGVIVMLTISPCSPNSPKKWRRGKNANCSSLDSRRNLRVDLCVDPRCTCHDSIGTPHSSL
jgi:hypothetical protein